MAVLYVPHFAYFTDNNGNPLVGGKLYSYAATTTTPKATYTTATGDIENTNPVVLDAYGRATVFLSGSYKFTLTDANDVPIRTTDNVTSFNATTATNEGFFQSFSGNGATTAFTLTDNLGTDEKALFVFAENEYSTNGTFASDTGWTKGTGWTIGSGVATATGAISTALEQTAGLTLVEGKSYSIKYTITRSAGTITLSLGGTAGTARSADGTYSETIIAGSTQTISFGTSGFTGTLDNVSIRDVTGPVIKNPNTYTVNGTALSFASAPASGTNNILVFAPYTLIGAAGAAQVAADQAIAAAATATAAETVTVAAAASVAGLNATSTTSLAIGTGGKSFTTQSGKGFIAGMWILATSDANPTNYMHGYVSSYSSTSLVMVSTNVGGSGTHADWTLRLSGTRGPEGPAGGVNNIDFSLLTTDNSPLASDEFLFDTAGALRKTNFDNMLKIIDTLSVETTVTLADDKFVFFDDDANSPRAITGTNLATALGAGGYPNNGYQTGRYYYGYGVQNPSATMVVTANRLYWRPMIIGAGFTATAVGINVATGAAGNARIGLYTLIDGRPDARLFDFGTVSTTTLGEKEIAISQALSAGVYAICVVFDAAPTITYASQIGNQLLGHFVGLTTITDDSMGAYGNFTYGALPSTFPTHTAYTANGGNPCLIWFKK
jgi:hypothetical protein